MMIRRLMGWLAVCGVALLAAGCVNTLDDQKQAGWPVKDTAVGKYERPVAQVYKAAEDVLGFNGVLVSKDVLKNTLEAKVNTSTVWVKVSEVDAKITSVTVQVRTKSGGTDLTLAHELDKQIALKLQ